MTANFPVRLLTLAVFFCAVTGAARAELEIDAGTPTPEPPTPEPIVRKAKPPAPLWPLATGGIAVAPSAEASLYPFVIANYFAYVPRPPVPRAYRDDTTRRNAARAQFRARAYSRDWDNRQELPCCYLDFRTLW